MKGKKLIMLAMAIVLLVAIPAVALAGHVDKAKSKAKPPTKIEAKFKFVDDTTAQSLTITGTAKGMDPGRTYRSLVYGLGSLVKGVNACKPSGDPPLTPDQMFVDFWSVTPDGKGTLAVTKGTTGNYVTISAIGTISVRGGGSAPVVVACGKVK